MKKIGNMLYMTAMMLVDCGYVCTYFHDDCNVDCWLTVRI